jgi:6-phosphogluconolactonase
MKVLNSSVLASHNKESRQGILIVHTGGVKEGSDLAEELLYEITDDNTVLFLSGGRTPEYLYTELVKEERLRIGGAAMVDERYGQPRHSISNELMILRTGLLDYFQKARIPFYPILEKEQSIENTASGYEAVLQYLFNHFPRSAAVLGIGEDGHLAGIAPERPDFSNPLFSRESRNRLVSWFIDPKPMSDTGSSLPPYGFGKRITMTFRGLSRIDILIILVFGENKQVALSQLFEEGSIEQAPSRFITKRDIAPKTVLITDREIL